MNDLAAQLGAIVGAGNVLTGSADIAPFVTDWLGKYRGSASAVVRPADTGQVAAIVALCHRRGVPIVPQGGNTSLSGGATPPDGGDAVVLSLTRMNAVREIDLVGNTMTVEAGCVLAEVQNKARAEERFFPLSLGAEGSCTIGGNLAANAGGVAVLRYGTMRELTLGLEVVLPDGRVWDGLRALRKDNSGYSLRDLFVGSEGTLGIITAAVLKLFPRPLASTTAFAAVPDASAALELLSVVRSACADRTTAFEFMARESIELVLDHVPGIRLPLSAMPDAAVLIELSDTSEEGALRERLETVLEAAHGRGLVDDAVVAQTEHQTDTFWHLREGISEALKRAGKAAKHDISVPVARMSEFLDGADAAVRQAFPSARPIVFGHLGDGNLHYNLLHGAGESPSDFATIAPLLTRIVHDEVQRCRGSISAEHGIGQLRAADMARYKTPVELELMISLKRLLDPAGLLNPGKLLPQDHSDGGIVHDLAG